MTVSKLTDLTMIVPAYEQPMMLRRQLDTWACYDRKLKERMTFLIVDDCSPTPLEPVVRKAHPTVRDRVKLYRMKHDVAWGRNIARNAAVQNADTKWVLNIDVDHVLPPMCANALFRFELHDVCWYRFPRCRIGKADETRQKDEIPDDAEFGAIKPHIDSHLMTRELFMSSPYDPEYQGFLGGGTPFLERMKKAAPVILLPQAIHLYVYTRHVIPDASVTTLDRDTSKYKAVRRAKELAGRTEPKNPFDYEWERIL